MIFVVEFYCEVKNNKEESTIINDNIISFDKKNKKNNSSNYIHKFSSIHNIYRNPDLQPIDKSNNQIYNKYQRYQYHPNLDKVSTIYFNMLFKV